MVVSFISPHQKSKVKDMPITIADVAYALYFIFPAYCANAAPVIFGGGPPIDSGKSFLDGRPVLGPRKTFRGFIVGLSIGTLVGFLQGFLPPLNGFLPKYPLIGFMLSLGALVGDLTESFVKRRLGFPPGASFPVADQLDFIAGALLFSLLVSPPPLHIALITVVITPPIHLLMNFLAYVVKLKKEWW